MPREGLSKQAVFDPLPKDEKKLAVGCPREEHDGKGTAMPEAGGAGLCEEQKGSQRRCRVVSTAVRMAWGGREREQEGIRLER